MDNNYKEPEYKCPLLETVVSDTICYDIQMVTGPGNLINKSFLLGYGSLIDASKVTDERAGVMCPQCPFNQLKQPAQVVENAA